MHFLDTGLVFSRSVVLKELHNLHKLQDTHNEQNKLSVLLLCQKRHIFYSHDLNSIEMLSLLLFYLLFFQQQILQMKHQMLPELFSYIARTLAMKDSLADQLSKKCFIDSNHKPTSAQTIKNNPSNEIIMSEVLSNRNLNQILLIICHRHSVHSLYSQLHVHKNVVSTSQSNPC